jgi:hypothetical protein
MGPINSMLSIVCALARPVRWMASKRTSFPSRVKVSPINVFDHHGRSFTNTNVVLVQLETEVNTSRNQRERLNMIVLIWSSHCLADTRWGRQCRNVFGIKRGDDVMGDFERRRAVGPDSFDAGLDRSRLEPSFGVRMGLCHAENIRMRFEFSRDAEWS